MGSHLSKYLDSILLALLPGLDDDTSEYFLKCVKVLEAISSAVTLPTFFVKLWSSILATQHHKGAALNFIMKIYPRKDDISTDILLTKQPKLVCSALCACLEDPDPFVVRSCLDLCLTHFLPAQMLELDQEVRLASSILGVLVRRDMSLSRRVFQWLYHNVSDYEHEHIGQHEARILTLSILVRIRLF